MISTQFGIVWRALARHKLASGIIVLQVAVGCAVLCNASYLVVEKLRATAIVTGVEESKLGFIRAEGLDAVQYADVNARILSGIQEVKGVDTVVGMNTVPFGMPELVGGVFLDEAQKHFGGVISFYLGAQGAPEALGLKLISGRFPNLDEYQPVDGSLPASASVLITRQLASHFWPGESPLGKRIWCFDTTVRVVGVVEHLSVPRPGAGEEKGTDWAVFVPTLPSEDFFGSYLVRTDTLDAVRVMPQVLERVTTLLPDAVVDSLASKSIQDQRKQFLRAPKVMAALLGAVILGVMGSTALGIVGLASFWVTQRRTQIGIRRALGATQKDIVAYFQIENLIIMGTGVLVGSVLAIALNVLAMHFYEIPRLPFVYIPIGAAVMLILGQLAILKPALDASRVLPVEAMRA